MDKPLPILVVSSEFKNRDALREILKREGWETICASTVGECEEVLASQNTDLVFCDRSLTDSSCRDILAIARSVGRNARLVVTSRLADCDEYPGALKDGAFDLIASPSRQVCLLLPARPSRPPPDAPSDPQRNIKNQRFDE